VYSPTPLSVLLLNSYGLQKILKEWAEKFER